tara:strand:+ start:1962 stop:4916 length:2955 start_codon:yes stop_codon:yes gene_type:complete
MTDSSFSNIIGTPRDQIPDISETNWQDPTPDLSKAANANITDNQEELKVFLQSLGEIQKQMASDDLDNLAQLDAFLGEGAKFKKLLDADKESRESLKKYKGISDDVKNQLKELEDLSELTDTELDAELQKLAFDKKTGKVDEQAFEFLKLKYFPTGEEVEFDGVKEVYDKHSISAFNTNIEDNFIYSAATEAQATDISEKVIRNIITKYYLDLNDKGIDINSREAQRYLNRHLLPDLIKEQSAAISTWKQLSTKRYFAATERKKDNFILSTITSSSVVEQPDGSKKIVYDGNLSSTLLKIQKIDGVNEQEALQIFHDRLPSLKNKMTPGGLNYLLFEVKIPHPSAKGGFITGFDSPEAYDLLKGNSGNVVQLERLLSEVTQTKDAIVKRIDNRFKGILRDYRKANNGQHLIDGEKGEQEVMKLVDQYRTALKSAGVDLDTVTIPPVFFGDESTTTNTEWSTKQQTFKNINNQDWVKDFKQEDNVLQGNRNLQIIKAKQWLEDELNKARGTFGANFDEDAWIAENYDKAITKLNRGDFKPDPSDFLILPRPEQVTQEKDNFLNDPTAWINNPKFNSLYEKDALGQYIEWKNNNYRGPIPNYFTSVGTANGDSGMQYAIKRLKALNMWDEKDENFINPEKALPLNEEDTKKLTIKSNLTKTYGLLDATDDNRKQEAKLLNTLRKTTPDRKVDYVKPKNNIGFSMLGAWIKPGTEIRSVKDVYNMAISGDFDKFGIYELTSEELIQAVNSGVVSLDDDFDENTQDFLAINLVRVKANQQKGIEGAVTEGYDWRRLINLSRADKALVLKYFPNLQGMTTNQFQDLQSDISLAILSDAEKKMKKIKEGEIVGVEEGDEGTGIFTRAYIQANPEFAFLNKGVKEEDIVVELESNQNKLLDRINRASKIVATSKNADKRMIELRLFFQNRIKQGLPVPDKIRKMLQNTRYEYAGTQRGSDTWKDDFNYLDYNVDTIDQLLQISAVKEARKK